MERSEEKKKHFWCHFKFYKKEVSLLISPPNQETTQCSVVMMRLPSKRKHSTVYIIYMYIIYISQYIYMFIYACDSWKKSIKIHHPHEIQGPNPKSNWCLFHLLQFFHSTLGFHQSAGMQTHGTGLIGTWSNNSRMLQFKSSYNLQLFRSNPSDVCNKCFIFTWH